MRILLAHNSLYYPSWGGGDKSNRLLMEALAARGHAVRVVSRIERFGAEAHENLMQQLEQRGVRAEVTEESVEFVLRGVLVHTLTRNPQWRAFFSAQLAEFDPDVIITSTDDPGQLLFDIARRTARPRLVYLVRATIATPFGPDSSMVSAVKTEALRDADGIVGVSEHVAGYVRKYGGMDAIHLPISLMDAGQAQNLARYDNPYVVMVNPCAVKGIVIFLELAARMPQVQFAGVPMWGTTPTDLAAMRALPNITMIEPVDNIDELFRQARVALVPSVWAEARSRVVMEAMLRGVPVVASDAGGLREAKMGVPYLLPVNTVKHYRHALDENMVPVADVPPQDLGPWVAALGRLTTDRSHWKEISVESRAAALNYERTLTAEPFEAFLYELQRRPKKARLQSGTAGESSKGAHLSEDKRKLMALRLKQRLAEKSHNAWFPNIGTTRSGDLRLFCFPHAGGGSLAYLPWVGTLPGVAVIPVLFPGRETRLQERPFEDMRSLIAALTEAIAPRLEAPYAFFGHSMGAGVAFELTRSLRRAGACPPKVLVVSGARAPQLRTAAATQRRPSDQEVLEDLRRLDGLPPEILDHPEALEIALRSLTADTLLYRNYVYHPESPLEIPIVAYGGAADPNAGAEDLESWKEQTTGSFRRREFAGGHFYLRTSASAVWDALRVDLADLSGLADESVCPTFRRG